MKVVVGSGSLLGNQTLLEVGEAAVHVVLQARLQEGNTANQSELTETNAHLWHDNPFTANISFQGDGNKLKTDHQNKETPPVTC